MIEFTNAKFTKIAEGWERLEIPLSIPEARPMRRVEFEEFAAVAYSDQIRLSGSVLGDGWEVKTFATADGEILAESRNGEYFLYE